MSCVRFFLVSLATVCALAGEGREFALDLSGGAPVRVASPMSLDERRTDFGVLRRNRLGVGAASTGMLEVGDGVALRLYDDVAFNLRLVEREVSELAGSSFQAVVEGGGGLRNAVVTETADGLMINIVGSHGRVYSVVSTADGVVVSETDQAAAPTSCAGSVVPRIPSDGVASNAVCRRKPTGVTSVSAEPVSTIVDILVAYDAPSSVWANNFGGGMTNYAQQAVTKMNAALANNSLDSLFRFRLVGVLAVEADAHGDFASALDQVQRAAPGWEAVAAKRDEVGADVVTVMIDTGTAYGTTGLGFSLTEVDPKRIPLFSDWAYNVVSVRAVEISHTMTHETGHNLGAGHADTQADDPGPQSFPYSSGYYFTGASGERFHTIMAYANDGYGGRAVEAPLFSSETARWDGVVAGDHDRHNNEQVLRLNYELASQFRPQVVPMAYDVFFSPGSGSLFSGALEVTLTPGKAGSSIRYTLDGSIPTKTNGTVYTSPIRITETTTVTAVVIMDGVAGPVYTATYYLSDISTALGTTDFVWYNSDASHPWSSQSDVTYDGRLAVVSGALEKDGAVHSTSLSTMHTGAATKMSFRYRTSMVYSNFSVCIDDLPVWVDATGCDEWRLVEVDIPSGRHEIEFCYTQGGYYLDPVFCGVWIDDIRFDALSRPPVMVTEPCDFRSSLTVTINPAVEDGRIFYTTDGSDPEGANAILYTKPFVLKKSTVVRVIEVDPFKAASVEVGGLFRERHMIEPGEWTEDVEGVKSAAKANGGSLICVVMLWKNTPNGWNEAFLETAHSLTFRNWARANGVYLLAADEENGLEYGSVLDYYNKLYASAGPSASNNYVQMYFADPDECETAVAQGIGVRSCGIGNKMYEGTYDSLIRCFGSILDAMGRGMKPYSVPGADEILGTKGVVWENGSGYPWREGASRGALRAGGMMSGSYVSTLRAKVSGPGKFIYSYKFNTWTSQNAFTFPVNGSQETRAYDKTLGEYQGGTVTNIVDSTGDTVFEWQYTVKDAMRDYDYRYSSEAGVWLYDVKWMPAKKPSVILFK